MKVLPVEKFIIYSIIILTLVFSFTIVRNHAIYSNATAAIRNGEYTDAITSLDKLENYRDSETLMEYCKIMCDYDSENFVSVYHCYQDLCELDLDNRGLSEVFARTTAEVETLYKYYDVSLSAK